MPLRQQFTRKSANQRSSSPWAYLTKQIYKQFPKMDYYICTSSLQVHCHFYKLKLQVLFISYFQKLNLTICKCHSVLISVLCLIVISTVKSKIQTVAFRLLKPCISLFILDLFVLLQPFLIDKLLTKHSKNLFQTNSKPTIAIKIYNLISF